MGSATARATADLSTSLKMTLFLSGEECWVRWLGGGARKRHAGPPGRRGTFGMGFPGVRCAYPGLPSRPPSGRTEASAVGRWTRWMFEGRWGSATARATADLSASLKMTLCGEWDGVTVGTANSMTVLAACAPARGQGQLQRLDEPTNQRCLSVRRAEILFKDPV